MRHCYILRVFTRGEEGGNHLGVVPDVTGLDDDAMQATARELGFSETIYLDWRQGGTPVARIFTPAREIPFAGHPLVGAAWVLSEMGPGGPERIACGVGDVGFRMDSGMAWIDPPAEQPVEEVMLDVSGWCDPVSTRRVLMPLPYEMVELSSPEEVAAVAPRPDDTLEVYVWAWAEPGRRIKARFFAAGMGVPEDPATGSAAVALAAVLRHAGHESGDVEIAQGDEMGHPSTLHLRWDGGSVSVGGRVVKDEVRVLEV